MGKVGAVRVDPENQLMTIGISCRADLSSQKQNP
jgi:hypothetical protein